MSLTAHNPADLSSLSRRDVDKIGSLLHLIAKKSGNIYLTRLLKLLYLIDEKSVKEIGVPVTPFEYRVAQNGPLIVELWTNLQQCNDFSKYIQISKEADIEGTKITAVGEPNEKRFSEYELELINDIVRDYRGYSTDELIDYIHEHKESLWKDIVSKKSVDFSSSKISALKIDFKEHIKGDETLIHFYETYKSVR